MSAPSSVSPLSVAPLDHPPHATVEVPGSKSHTNRALVCAALATGTSVLHRVLLADDSHAMLGALAALGVRIDRPGDATTATVHGLGGAPHLTGNPTVSVNQSGTTGRFLLPVLAVAEGAAVLDGDPQLRARPFGDLVDALRTLGAELDGDTLPIAVGAVPIRGGEVTVSGQVSSQFLSGLLLAAPVAPAPITLTVEGDLVSVPYVDLTLATMADFGVAVVTETGETDDGVAFRRYRVPNGGYTAAEVGLEPDASAASYFFAAAAVTGGTVRIEGLGPTSVQGDVAFVDVLERMGATVVRDDDAIEVTGPDRLAGVEVDMRDISDTAQTLAAIAPFASGPTRVTGIGFIRRKETDRLAAVVAQLRARGVDAVEDDDGFTIQPGPIGPGVVDTYDDHRMAMSFAVMGLATPGIEIADPGCVAKTFPHFFDVLDGLRR